MKEFINTAPLLIPQSWDIDQTIKAMIRIRVSSALVYDSKERIIGIVTERDILRKIALLDIDRKLGHKVNTIMTRPVEFAQLATLNDDVARLHRDFGLRHFPVKRNAEEATCDNIVGILTVTDIARSFLDNPSNSLISEYREGNLRRIKG